MLIWALSVGSFNASNSVHQMLILRYTLISLSNGAVKTENKALCNSTLFIKGNVSIFPGLWSANQTLKQAHSTHRQQTSESHLWSIHPSHLPVNLITIWRLWRRMISDTWWDRFASCFSLRCYFLHTVKNWQLVDLKCLLYGLLRCIFYYLILKKTPIIMFHYLQLILSQHNLLAKIGVWRFHSTFHSKI